jgi:hypothetical protein
MKFSNRNNCCKYFLLFFMVIMWGYHALAGDVSIDRSNVGGDVAGGNIVHNYPSQKSIYELSAGQWTLSSYTENHVGGIEYGFLIDWGTLSIDQSGKAQWTVRIRDKYNSNMGPLELRAYGQINPDKTMNPIKGGQYNYTKWIGNNWQIDMPVTEMSVRGWYPGETPDSFSVNATQGVLQMQNRRGSYTWVRK